MCSGDLNDMLSLDDKLGGFSYPGYLLRGFQGIVSDCQLLNIPLSLIMLSHGERMGYRCLD